MDDNTRFRGFPREALRFFRALAKNNRRAWFTSRKEEYQDVVVEPAQAFVGALGPRLRALSPQIGYDTRTNGQGSIRRIYRDIRFSKDKTPYKTNLGILFWYGARGQMGSIPGFWFHMEAAEGRIYSGMYAFPPELLKAYRAAVADPRRGAGLVRTIRRIEAKPGFEVGGESYQRVPAGFDPASPRADLLRYGSLYAISPRLTPALLTSPGLVGLCVAHCRVMLGLNAWLLQVVESAR